MVKKGKLNNTEKFAIQGAVHNGKTSEEIASMLDRSVTAVDNYINGELNDLLTTITTAKLQQTPPKASRYQTPKKEDIATVKPKKEGINYNVVSDPEIISKTVDRLINAGLTHDDSIALVESTLEFANKNNIVYDKEDVFFTACIKRMGAGKFIIKRTAGGREGVAIMSGTASTKSDSAKKRNTKATRKTRNNIYNPQTKDYM